MRKTLYASILALALCGSALAGDISNPSKPQPPPPPQSTTAEEHATDVETPSGAPNDFAETLLSMLESALETVLSLH